MTDILGEDEFTELVDADIQRVDLVGKGANGLPFLIAKSAGGLFPTGMVADLVAKATPEPDSEESTVTLTGSPAAIARLIHEAPTRVSKKDFDTAERKHDAATGAAMPDGSYPIENKAQLDDAIHAVGRGKGDHDAIRRHIIRRAKSLGAESAIPDNWKADGSMSDDVSKADMESPVTADDLIPDPEAGDPDASAPGSPEWEQLDGDTACQLIAVLGRVKAAIDWLSAREAQEAVTVDPDDADNVLDLNQACDAVDCAISILAPFAAGEQLEADLAGELEQVGKAAADAAGPLAVLEPLAAVAKAGRVLSSSNEQAIRDAVAALQKVLASLPASVPTGDEPVVAKEAVVAETPAPEATNTIQDQPAEPAVKAKGDPVVIAYNAAGKAIGIVDPEDLQPISDDASAAESDEHPDEPEQAPPEATHDDTAEPATEDAHQIPGTDTIQSPPEAPEDDEDAPVAKADEVTQQVAAEFAAAFAEALTPLAKQNADLAGTVQVLKERVEQFGALPDDRRSPILNGGTGEPGLAARDTTATAVDEVADLAKQAADETDPRKKQELAFAAAFAAVKKAQSEHPRTVGTVPPTNFADVLARFTQQ